MGRENSHCGEGCVQLKIWRNKPLGFVRCKGDGVDETLQYYLTENSTICKLLQSFLILLNDF